MPYLLDYTPSGAHFLWQNPLNTRATKEIEKIGYLEEDLIKACQYIDNNDIKRWWGISLEAARVFSGLGKLAEYLSVITMEAFQENTSQGKLPVTISDSIDRCINFGNSWVEGSPFMRSIRSPFSLHKKNHDLYRVFLHPPLVDVVGGYYDGDNLIEERDVDRIVDCMWNLEKAAEYAQRFSGIIPESNDTMIDFVQEYKQSQLCEFHNDFERTEDLPRFEALARAKRDPHSTDFVKHILHFPNPLALQPKNMMGFVYDLLF